jgi:hypothetical protein
VELGITPKVTTGILHIDAGIGQVGAGLVKPPRVCFDLALEALVKERRGT